MSTTRVFPLAMLIGGCLVVSSAFGSWQIGLGTGFGGGLDSAGSRLNVDEAFLTLPRGTYDVLDYSSNLGAIGGTLTPFLSKSTGTNVYESLWVGPGFNPVATGVQTDTFAPGGQQFYLPSTTNVYAGFAQSAAMVLQSNQGGRTDHHGNSSLLPTGPGQTVSGFSNPDLARNYAFSLNVAKLIPDGLIYYDNFDGSNAAGLNSTAPDVRPVLETWTAGSLLMADGSKSNNGTSSAWLPLVPQAGKLYTLSLDVNPDISGSSDWFALGFSQNNGTGNFHDGGNNAVAWLLNRENDASASVVQTFLGPVTSNGASHDFDPDKVGFVNLMVELDTRGTAWTSEWFVDGASIRGPVAFGTNPTINYVGFAGYSTAAGVVDNFRLMVTTPEPTTLLIWSLLAGLGIGWGWRRRK